MNGIINIYKEKGYTSHDVVAKLRGILKQKKIGHTGTLDPNARGVLPICLGKATKISGLIIDTDKAYEVVCRLGVTTDTQDSTGRVLGERAVTCTENEVYEAVSTFLGVQEQIPPMYSAIKVNGKRLYELARKDVTIERKPRRVTFHEINIKDLDIRRGFVKMEVVCSKGTYMRTLCHDIGEKLGFGACMEDLVRTKVGRFILKEAITLNQVEEAVLHGCLKERLTPIDAMFEAYLPVRVKKERQKALLNGMGFTVEHLESGRSHCDTGQKVRAYDHEGQFIGLYEYLGEQEGFHLIKMFV